MNILVIRTNRFGDILQLTPMVEGLKKAYPRSRIVFVTGRDFTDLLESNPFIDSLIPIPEKEYRFVAKNRPEEHSRVFNELHGLVSKLQGERFDLVINRQYESGALLAYLIGCKKIVGGSYSPESRFHFQDQTSEDLFEIVRTNRKRNRRNLVDWACSIAGLDSGAGRMVFCISEWDRWEASRLFPGSLQIGDKPVAIQMGAARSFRQWGIENYTSVIEWLVDTKKRRVVLLGSKDEAELSKAVQDSLGHSENVFDLVGKTSLRSLGAVLERCECLITGDTGTMHMAAAVGTPVLAIFYGTAYPWETGPYGEGHLVLYADEPCAPCLHPNECKSGHRCRKAITPECVIKAYDIGEELRKDRYSTSGWPDGMVRLYMTCAQPDQDQVLIPIDEISAVMKGFGSFPGKQTRTELDGKKALESGASSLIEKGAGVILSFYSGKTQEFLESLPGYFDRWGKFMEFLNDVTPRDNAQVLQLLGPVLNEACRAMEAEDYVTVIDIIQYRFKPILDSLGRR